MANELQNMLTFAHEVAWNAGKVTLRYFQTNLGIELKADESPVTKADRETEIYIRSAIESEYPNHGILGEEFGETNSNATYRWIIDPIDGTKSFIRGVPLYSVMIGLEREGTPILGVVNFPALSEVIYAADGLGCWWNGRTCHVSETDNLKASLVLASVAKGYDKHNKHAIYERLLAEAGTFRTWGDSYGYILVATGRAEVMFDPSIKIWDVAALLPILREAGGTFTDWSGSASIYVDDGLGTNGILLNDILKLIMGNGLRTE